MSQPQGGFDRRAEVERLLASDTTALGRLWKYEQDELSPPQMSDLEGLASIAWVSRYRTLLRAVRDGEIPTSPSAAQMAAQRLHA